MTVRCQAALRDTRARQQCLSQTVEGPKSRFAIDVTREGGWWMGHIPSVAG